MMKFAVEKTVRGCRIGLLELSSGLETSGKHDINIDTPGCMLYSRAGSVPSLTRDMLDRLENPPKLIHMPLPLLVKHHEAVKEYGKGIGSFTALADFAVYCSIQDPAVSYSPGYNDRNGISVWNKYGRFKIDAEIYTKIMDAFRPQMSQVVCDSDSDENSTKKRLMKSGKMTESYYEQCAEKKAAMEGLKRCCFLGTLTGGFDKEERLKSAKFLKSQNVDGVVFEGFHRFGPETETFDFSLVREMVTEVQQVWKQDSCKVHIWSGIMDPRNVLLAAESGIDLMDSSFPYLVSERGGALVFRYDGCHGDAGDMSDCTEINLKDKKYAEELSPLLESCSCFTCKHHTKAYINHLLNTSELLAYVLLNMHNFHHYFRFFEAFRHSLQNDTYSDFRELINKQYPGVKDDALQTAAV